jgi:hypothetical protein
MHKLLLEWTPITPVSALELLDARFADRYIFRYNFYENGGRQAEIFQIKTCQNSVLFNLLIEMSESMQ